MMSRSIYGLVLILMLILASCEEEIDITGDHDSLPVVYCLLDPADSIHYLRISRSFVVKSNPNEIDIPSDSLILNDDFYAYLEEEKPGGTGDITYFDPARVSERDSGFFPQEGLVTMSVKRKIKAGEIYGLYIHLPGTPKLLHGNTNVIKPVKILDPSPLPGRETTILHGQGYTMRWSSSSEYSVYQPIIRINYYEGDSIFHSLKSVELNRRVVFVNESSEYISSFINGASFFKQLIENMNEPPAGEKRKIVSFDVELYAGGEELALAASTGYGAFQSFTGLNDYSNIDGAAGVFSCISSAVSINNRFSDFTIDYLAMSDSTKHLGFLKHNQDFQ